VLISARLMLYLLEVYMLLPVWA